MRNRTKYFLVTRTMEQIQKSRILGKRDGVGCVTFRRDFSRQLDLLREFSAVADVGGGFHVDHIFCDVDCEIADAFEPA
jgi:hypothetical protein